MSTAWQAITSTVIGKTAVAAVSAVAIAAGSLAVAGAINQDRGEVVRIVDGDTLVINYRHQDETVRLLNIDTPETKDPNKPVECLGTEATQTLENIVPPGTKVRLAFDIERKDRYGRTLAAVFVGDSLVNAEIARRGLGHAVYYEPNKKYLSQVQQAQAQAEASDLGMYDPSIGCTIPGQVEEAVEQVEAAMAATPENTSSATGETLTALAAALAAAKSIESSLHAATNTADAILWAALATTERNRLTSQISATIKSGEAKQEQLSERRDKLKAAEEKAAAEKKAAEKKRKAEAKAKAERIAAEKKAAKERAAAERVAAEQAAAQAAEAARQTQIADAERQRQFQQQEAPAPAPPASNPYPGYTGPRCYAPGGQSWKPCP
ncbi:thermonuclease family protein [Arthrobacter sp. NPDC089319]|uniref:thermonuclease family protein n=1 Tax=Arthrobacter sp. NPDC089319 TaxID=3155915 RepID=UPI00341A1D16